MASTTPRKPTDRRSTTCSPASGWASRWISHMRERPQNDQAYLKSAAEMAALFADLPWGPAALATTMRDRRASATSRCSKPHCVAPQVPLPAGMTPTTQLRALCERRTDEALCRVIQQALHARRSPASATGARTGRHLDAGVGGVLPLRPRHRLRRPRHGHPLSADGAAPPTASSPICWRSPASIRSSMGCSSSAFSTPNARACPISTSTSSPTAARS